MRPATVVDLAAKNHIELPTDDPVELYSYTSLDSFLEVFWLVQSLLVDRDDWARLAYEAVRDSAAHGLVSESSSSPRPVTSRRASGCRTSWPASTTAWLRRSARPVRTCG